MALAAATMGIEPDRYKTYALSQINYMLGDNNDSFSYVIGLGNDYPTRPHHRGRYVVLFLSVSRLNLYLIWLEWTFISRLRFNSLRNRYDRSVWDILFLDCLFVPLSNDVSLGIVWNQVVCIYFPTRISHSVFVRQRGVSFWQFYQTRWTF